MKIFRYLPEVDSFDVTTEYALLADRLGLIEWNPVVWLGRLFLMDNDVGEHWFDNWDAREERREAAEKLGLDTASLLIVDPDKFQDGKDGPCHSPEIRKRFWTEVLNGLDLSVEFLFEKARHQNLQIRRAIDAGRSDLEDLYITDLESRIDSWRASHAGLAGVRENGV